MNAESKVCKTCACNFTIDPADFDFYSMMNVVPPTTCPQCRMIQRMTHLNVRTLYKRTCDLCGENKISMYPEGTKFPVYCTKCWWSDKWDALSYGMDVDFSRPFLEQVKELWNKCPEISPSVMYTTMVNSDYTNIVSALKNCYLIFNSDYDEDCAYGTYVERSKNTYDTYMVDQLDHCYECVNVRRSFKTFYSIDCENCVEVWLSRNLSGCTNCFGCINLRGKKYCIFNEQFDKETYEQKIAKLYDGNRDSLVALMKQFSEFQMQFPRRYMTGTKNANVTGEYINESKNVTKSYEIVGGEEVKYSQFVFIAKSKDIQDVTMWGGGLERAYNCMGVGDSQNTIISCINCWAQCQNIYYCREILASSSNLFGCTSVGSKNYCILNKQYTKEEYLELVPKIIKHMNDMPYVDKDGREYRFGDFFPSEISHFGYNETVAQDHFPLTKDQALQKGYAWKDEDVRNYSATISAGNVPKTAAEVSDTFVNEIIECESKGNQLAKCSTAFRLIPSELTFYKTHNLPIPTKCSNCRHYDRLQLKNGLNLYSRTCTCTKDTHDHTGHCQNAFQTSYSDNRPEIVYCESCYQKEVL